MKSVFSIGVALSLSIMSYLVGQDAPQDRIEKLEKRIDSLSEELKVRGGDVDRLDTEIIPSLKQQILAAKAEQSKEAGALRTSLDVGLLRAIPIGTIVSWSGGLDSLPDTWAVCDGRTVNGIKTPDLRSHFLRGAGPTPDSTLNSTGGNDSIPAHWHNLDTDCRAVRVSFSDSSASFRQNFAAHSKKIESLRADDVVWSAERIPLWNGEPDLQHGHSFGTGFVTGTTKSAGGGDNRPAYYSVHFIMRVK
jgi:hypothetical protein